MTVWVFSIFVYTSFLSLHSAVKFGDMVTLASALIRASSEILLLNGKLTPVYLAIPYDARVHP